MIFAHEQIITEWYFVSLKIQMVKAKMNICLSLPVYSQPQFYVKYKIWKYN